MKTVNSVVWVLNYFNNFRPLPLGTANALSQA